MLEINFFYCEGENLKSFFKHLSCIIKQGLKSFALLSTRCDFHSQTIKTDELDYGNEFSKFRKCFFKVAYHWLSMMFQCFCQHVSTDGICQLSYRFCQTKHRTISGYWVCHCQVNTYEQYSLNIPCQQAALGYGKMYFVHV